MLETRNNCFGSKKRSTAILQAKTGKHECRNIKSTSVIQLYLHTMCYTNGILKFTLVLIKQYNCIIFSYPGSIAVLGRYCPIHPKLMSIGNSDLYRPVSIDADQYWIHNFKMFEKFDIWFFKTLFFSRKIKASKQF